MIKKQLIEAYKQGLRKGIALREAVWVPKDYGPDHLFWIEPEFLNVRLSNKVARETWELKKQDKEGGEAYEGALLLKLQYKYWQTRHSIPYYDISETVTYCKKILPGLEKTKIIDETEKKELVEFVKSLLAWAKRSLANRDKRIGRSQQTYGRKEKIKAEQQKRDTQKS